MVMQARVHVLGALLAMGSCASPWSVSAREIDDPTTWSVCTGLDLPRTSTQLNESPCAAGAGCRPSSPSDEHTRYVDTLADAQRELRARRAAGYRGALTIQVCNGNDLLALHGQIVLGAADSGVAGGPTVLRGTSSTTLDPGVPVTGWVKRKGSPLWEAHLPAGISSRQFWVNGRRAARAHANPTSCSGGPTPGPEPCLSLLRGSAAITPTGYANVTTVLNVTVTGSPNLQHWLVPGAEFVYGKGASGASWTQPRCAVSRVVPAASPGMVNIEMAQPCWARATGKSAPLPWDTGQAVTFPTDIENAFALLSEAGEWFANFSSRVISYYPLPSDDMATAVSVLGGVPGPQHVASPNRPGHHGMMDSLLKVDAGARHIQIEQLTFQHHTWLIPSTGIGYVDTQSGWACIYGESPIAGYPINSSAGTPYLGCGDAISGQLSAVPGTLHIHGAYDISVRNCTFMHLGRSAIVTDAGSQNITLEDNVIADVSGGAISLGNTSQPMLSPSKIDSSLVVTRNHIRSTGQEFLGAAGIFAGYVAHTQIRSNDIANTSNGAVTLGWGWGATNTMQNNSVTSNKIVRSNTQLFDCGSIYTLSAQPHSEIAYNYIVNQVLLFGSLYHDAHSAFFHTHHNVVSGGPMWLYLQGPPCCEQANVSNITVESNWHNQQVAGGCNSKPAIMCTGVKVQNNTLVSGESWPAAALAIVAAAGIPSPNAQRSKTDDVLFSVDWNCTAAVTVASASWHDVAAGADGNPRHDHVFPPSEYDIVDELAARRRELATLWPRLFFSSSAILDWPNSTRQVVWCPKPGNGSRWDFTAMDIKVLAVQTNVKFPETTILMVHGLPPWACADRTCANATAGLADPSGQQLGEYYSRILSWYSNGGFVDQGVHYQSGYNISFGYLEVLNEIDINPHIYSSSDPIVNARRYVAIYDGVTRSVRRDHPRMKFIGSCFSGPGLAAHWAYFLDRSKHAPGTPWPPEGVSFHAYVDIPGSSFVPFEKWGDMLFEQAVTVLNNARGSMQVIKAASPQTKVFANEIGICNTCSGALRFMNVASLRSANASWWNLHSALWAVMHGELVAMGVSMTGASGLLGYPTGPPGSPVGVPGPAPTLGTIFQPQVTTLGNCPDMSLVDWETGLGNARLWTLRMVIDGLGTGEKRVLCTRPTNSSTGAPWDKTGIYARAFAPADGANAFPGPSNQALLISNTRNVSTGPVYFGAPFLSGSVVWKVETGRSGFDSVPYSTETLTSEVVTLGPWAVALLFAPQEPLS